MTLSSMGERIYKGRVVVCKSTELASLELRAKQGKRMGKFVAGVFLTAMVVLMVAVGVRSRPSPDAEQFPTEWKSASVSFSGSDDSGNNTTQKGNACGYGDADAEEKAYGVLTASVSGALFKKGQGCGACYEVECVGNTEGSFMQCRGSGASLVVTATDLCPVNYKYGLCNDTNGDHFAMSREAFSAIVSLENAPLVQQTVQYRRVSCGSVKRQGGVIFTMYGDLTETEVVITNLGRGRNVTRVRATWPGLKGGEWKELTQGVSTKAKPSNTKAWKISQSLQGHVITFQLFTGDGRQLTAAAVIPKFWNDGDDFEGPNFAS